MKRFPGIKCYQTRAYTTSEKTSTVSNAESTLVSIVSTSTTTNSTTVVTTGNLTEPSITTNKLNLTSLIQF